MKVYLRLLSYLRPFMGTVILAVWLNLTIAVLQGFSVWVGAEFIERILSSRPGGAIASSGIAAIAALDHMASVILQRPTPFGTVMAGAITLVAARLGVGGLKIGKMVLLARINQSILARIRDELFEVLTRADLAFSQKNRPGEIASVFVKDVDQLNEALFDATDRAILHPFRLMLIFLLMFGQSFVLTLWVLIFMVIGGLLIHYSGGRIQRLCRIALEKISQMQGHLTEYLSSAMLARFMNREEVEQRRFNALSQMISDKLVRIVFMRNLAPQVVRGLFSIAGGLLLVIGGYQVFIAGSLTSGALLKIVLLLPMAVISIEAIAALYMTQRVSIASADRVFDLMDIAVPESDPPDAIPISAFNERIVLDDVGLEMDGKSLLEGISLSIPARSTVAVCGPNGSGKSTLLAMLAGIHRPSRGAITVDGLDLARARIGDWRKLLGVVPQESIMINGTVRENLVYGISGIEDAVLESVLGQVYLGRESGALPEGLDTPVGNRGDLLSGGERQRLAIARALLTNPSILLMDEPTSMVDMESRQMITQAIWRAAQNRTLIIVTHDPDIANKANYTIRLNNGCLAQTDHP